MNAIISVLLLIGLASGEAYSQCLKYEPAVVKLKGTLISRTFPGPPEYSSISRGDRAERALLLLLDEPICVEGNKSSDINTEWESDVVLVHVAPTSGYNISDELMNKKVIVTGTLFHSITGHHRTKVLILTGSVKLEKTTK